MDQAPKSQWSVLLNLLQDRITETAEANKDDAQSMSLEAHNAYNRAAFASLRGEIASRDDIPNAVMNPPTQMLTLTFYGGWNETSCHGCLDFRDADDVTRRSPRQRERARRCHKGRLAAMHFRCALWGTPHGA